MYFNGGDYFFLKLSDGGESLVEKIVHFLLIYRRMASSTQSVAEESPLKKYVHINAGKNVGAVIAVNNDAYEITGRSSFYHNPAASAFEMAVTKLFAQLFHGLAEGTRRGWIGA